MSSSFSLQAEQQNGNLVASELEKVIPSRPGLSLLWLHLTVFNLQLQLGLRALGQPGLTDLG